MSVEERNSVQEGNEEEVVEEGSAVEETPGEDPEAHQATIEAVLFSSEIPLTAIRLGQLASCGKRAALEAIDRLNVLYGETSRAFRISPLAGGFQLVTTPEHAEVLAKLHRERVPTRLSQAALETLSIIAFKQPVTRAEIDAIRGVSASDRVLRNLIDRKLVRIAGRAEAPGRPLLYGTTREFLAYFGLSAVSDLPRTEELDALLAGEVPRSVAPEVEREAVAMEDIGTERDPLFERPAGMMEEEASSSDTAEDAEEPLSHSERESDDDERPAET